MFDVALLDWVQDQKDFFVFFRNLLGAEWNGKGGLLDAGLQSKYDAWQWVWALAGRTYRLPIWHTFLGTSFNANTYTQFSSAPYTMYTHLTSRTVAAPSTQRTYHSEVINNGVSPFHGYAPRCSIGSKRKTIESRGQSTRRQNRRFISIGQVWHRGLRSTCDDRQWVRATASRTYRQNALAYISSFFRPSPPSSQQIAPWY